MTDAFDISPRTKRDDQAIDPARSTMGGGSDGLHDASEARHPFFTVTYPEALARLNAKRASGRTRRPLFDLHTGERVR